MVQVVILAAAIFNVEQQRRVWDEEDVKAGRSGVLRNQGN